MLAQDKTAVISQQEMKLWLLGDSEFGDWRRGGTLKNLGEAGGEEEIGKCTLVLFVIIDN